MYRFYRSKNKYKALPAYYNGFTYASIKEMKYAMDLDFRKKVHDIKDWDKQIKIPLIVNGVKVCTYIPDFKVIHNNDTIELVEVKGFKTSVFKLKLKLFKATYLKENPEIKYTIEE